MYSLKEHIKSFTKDGFIQVLTNEFTAVLCLSNVSEYSERELIETLKVFIKN